MSSSFEKSVKGATKIKNAPPKTKYIEHILVATHSGEAGIGEVFRALQHRLRDSTWTVALKSLITVHLMIREGSPDVTLVFLAKHRNMLSLGHISDAQTQGRNIRHYANYLAERARAYRDTRTDWVRAPESRLERLSVDKGLLRETETVQHQISALVKCDVLESEPENEITIAVFRLLVLDLLALFQMVNQGLINILGHFFEMSKPDAERAMDIYRTFTRQTDAVVQYLSVARLHEHHTRVEVPKLKHAPVNLGRQLEEYLKDSDFEVNRRQYLAEQDAKKKGIRTASGKTAKATGLAFPKPSSPAANNAFVVSGDSKPQANKGPDPDLIDFFDSIEENQTTMQQPAMSFPPNGFAPQPTGFVSNDPFQQQNMTSQPQQLQPNFTGAGFGGFTPMPQQGFQPGALGPIPQNSTASFQNQGLPGQQQVGLQPMQTGQTTNPFRQSMLMAQQTGMQSSTPRFSAASGTPALNRQSTNPFARSPPPGSSPFQSQPPAAVAPLQPMATGTNPFARSSPQSLEQQQQQQGQMQAGLLPQPTGTTNPFRHGAFVNHATGMGWQHNQAPIGGGIDQLSTVPVFPRPAQQTPWQQ
ncbi:ANTH domain-containing protein [Hirsutella rhossiliensis]|uniref:ANTH domain-containing protein n=1 Tax=Hirsutella rhossiliensis TaxID=111463 RepID=A0A9P8SFN5_9HYPO|nr:ANTH domain-containing protein [Hirsutella rhossiliensis]KAH0959196.1 ANTH domain-containing protein [Hirsutella rhossiliensis]